MILSTVLQFIGTLQDAFTQLGRSVPLAQVEEQAFLFHSCMVGDRRKFHTAQHALQVAQSEDPIEKLAGLTHDIIYLQVDGGIPPRARVWLQDILHLQDKEVILETPGRGNDWAVDLAVDLFEIRPGRFPMNQNGLNEFLSALVALRSLQPHLDKTQLVAIATLIQGTIPFRKLDAEGRSCFDRLEARVESINQQQRLGLTSSEIQRMVRSAADLANRDVMGFAVEDPAVFLDNTCMLLAEGNRVFDESEVYSIREYRTVLWNIESFFHTLNPKDVFHAYQGIPNSREHARLTRFANANLAAAKEYLGIKLLSVGIIEALALASGGDAPLSLFIGDLRNGNPSHPRIEDFLPRIPRDVRKKQADRLDPIFYGRAIRCESDLRTAPVCYFLYHSLGTRNCHKCLVWVKEMFADRCSPQSFLKRLDPKILGAIAGACHKLAVTRRSGLAPYQP